MLWHLLPARIARQGVGNVTVCTNARTGLALESGSRPGPTRSRGAGPRHGHRTNADESRPCRGPAITGRVMPRIVATAQIPSVTTDSPTQMGCQLALPRSRPIAHSNTRVPTAPQNQVVNAATGRCSCCPRLEIDGTAGGDVRKAGEM